MKRSIVAALAVLLASHVAFAEGEATVSVGTTRADVLAILGEPSGVLELGGKEFLLYERGRVDLVGGLVTEAKLISEAELTARREKERIEAEKRFAMAQKARADRIAQGTALRNARLADPSFLAKPARERVDYWRWFRANYPEVDVGDDYTLALRERQVELDTERADADRRREIDALEARVERAEQRAADAEREARNATRSAGFVSYYPVVYPPVCVTPKPPCVRPCTHRPPCGGSGAGSGSGISVDIRYGSPFNRVGTFDMVVPPVVRGSGYF